MRDTLLTVIDFETTGTVRGFPNEPWQIGMVKLERGRVVAESCYDSLLRVGDRPFNRHAPGRHAERRAEIAAAPSLAELWPHICGWLVGRPLVAHNVGTERTVLGKAAPLHRFGPWVDTLRIVRKAYPMLKNHKLEHVILSLGLAERVADLVPGREAHDALYDAVSSAVLLESLLALPAWSTVTVAALTS